MASTPKRKLAALKRRKKPSYPGELINKMNDLKK